MKMIPCIFGSLSLMFLLIQGTVSENTFCPESVKSVRVVERCPSSVDELYNATRRMNCTVLALSQQCTTVEKFKYHCVINSYRNQTLEVCAQERLIHGYCTEFNRLGGIIQLHETAPCKEFEFPKCAALYYSSEAYKYPDCYALVNNTQGIVSTRPTTETVKTEITSTTGKTENGDSTSSIATIVSLTAIGIGVCIGIVIVILYRKKKICQKRGERMRKPSGVVQEGDNKPLMSRPPEGKDIERLEMGDSSADKIAIATCTTYEDLRMQNLEESNHYIKSYKVFDKYFVETSIYQQVQETLNKYGYVVWSGRSGCGKTIGAIHLILKHFHSKEWTFRKIRSWKELSCIEDNKKTIILIDNIFYRNSIVSDLESWWGELDKIFNSYIQNNENEPMSSRLRCIITARTNVIERACLFMGRITPILQENSHIKESCHTNKNVLTEDEKKEILKKQVEFAKREKNILIQDMNCDFSKIVNKSDGPIGFPLCAHLFVCKEEYRKQGVKFFSHPIQYLKFQIKDEILGDRSNRTKSLFFVLFFYEWHIKMGNSERLEIKSDHQCRRFLDGVSRDLRKHFEPFDFRGLSSEAQRLSGAFLKEEMEDIYRFVHDSVYEAVGALLCETYVTPTAKYFPLEIIQNQEYEYATESQRGILVTRLLYETLHQRFSEVFASKLFQNESFADFFVSELKKKEDKLLNLFFTAPNESSTAKLPCLFWTSYNNLTYLSERLWDLVNEKGMNTEYLLFVSLYGVCCAVKTDLLKTVNGKLRDKVDEIRLNVLNFNADDDSSILHILIASDRSDEFVSVVVEKLLGDELVSVDLKNKTKVTPLMLAVENKIRRTKVIEKLVKRSAKFSSDSKGFNVFHYCVGSCNDDETCAKYLEIILRSKQVEKYLSKNDMCGNTALCIAAMESKFSRICSILTILNHSSEDAITTLNDEGFSAVDLCVKSLAGMSEYAELECCVRVILLLVFGGSPENESDTNDKAIEKCEYDVIKDILNHPKDEDLMEKSLGNLLQKCSVGESNENSQLPAFSKEISSKLKERIGQAVVVLKNKSLA